MHADQYEGISSHYANSNVDEIRLTFWGDEALHKVQFSSVA